MADLLLLDVGDWLHCIFPSLVMLLWLWPRGQAMKRIENEL